MIMTLIMIMIIVMTDGRKYECDSLNWVKFKLLGQAVRPSFNQKISHLGHIEGVHVVVISHVEVTIALPDLV